MDIDPKQRLLELEAEIARLRRIDDERHARIAADINRRVDVETELLRFAAGKRGPIEPEEARRLALKLGVPEWFNEMVAEKAGASAPRGRRGGEIVTTDEDRYDVVNGQLVYRTSTSASAATGGAFQSGVHDWMMVCFNAAIAADIVERCDRFIEEALELAQANGWPADRAHALVNYVYGRDQGDINQEVGGVMVTLAALCNAIGVDMDAAAQTELARVWTKVEAIRAKHAAKPTGSALPVAASVPAAKVWRVKPLKWTEDAGDKFCERVWFAPTIGGLYHIEQRADDKFDLWTPGAAEAMRYSRREDAEAGANALHEARISAAIEPAQA